MTILGMEPIYFWLICIVAFAVIEAATLSLNSIWFSAGSLLAMIFSVFTSSLVLQFAVFLVGTIVMLFALKPLVQKLATPDTQATNFDRVLGQIAIVTEKITYDTGRIKVLGQSWSAQSNNSSEILEGEKVIVKKVVGVKAIVEKI